MASAAQIIGTQEISETKYSEIAAIGALYEALSKGIKSMQKGEAYTVDNAWEEIEKI